jgi:hypothetical protein
MKSKQPQNDGGENVKTKIAVLGLTLLAVFSSSVLNIWIIPSIEAVILGNGCREGQVLGELLILLIPLGLIIGGGNYLWQMRKRSMTLERVNILPFLGASTFTTTGIIWFFNKLMDLWLCLTISGWV